MNKEELRKKLKMSKVPDYYYDLDKGWIDEGFVLRRKKKNSDVFEVFYSERGVNSEGKEFPSEDEACQYFYQRLLSLPEIKNRV